MNRDELTLINVGQSLDDLANLDPRGYGVSRILYDAARRRAGEPLSVRAAKVLSGEVTEGSLVFILTGFVLLPHKKAEMDGLVGSLALARALVVAFAAKPVIVCPEDCLRSVRNMAGVVGLHLYETIEELREYPISMAVVPFTKDPGVAGAQAESLIARARPAAVISVEAPGANAAGVYHNAAGADVTELEAKTDILFNKLKEVGVPTLSIGDLGNEIGLGAIGDHIDHYVPRAKRCACPCGAGIRASSAADHLITATVSDWGCYALIAALAYLSGDVDICLDGEQAAELITAASRSGLVDMGGWLVSAVDGFGIAMNVHIAALMRECVASALELRKTCGPWFDGVLTLGFFEEPHRG
jgi:hypothetical protein